MTQIFDWWCELAVWALNAKGTPARIGIALLFIPWLIVAALLLVACGIEKLTTQWRKKKMSGNKIEFINVVKTCGGSGGGSNKDVTKIDTGTPYQPTADPRPFLIAFAVTLLLVFVAVIALSVFVR